MATTTSTPNPGPDEMPHLAQPVNTRSMDERELMMENRERNVYLAQKDLEEDQAKFAADLNELASYRRANASYVDFCFNLKKRRADLLRPYRQAEWDLQAKMQSRIDKLEMDLRVARNRNSDYDRRLTENRRTVAKEVAMKVEKELVRREDELVHQVRMELDAARHSAKTFEDQLAEAISTNSDLSAKLTEATKEYAELKDEFDSYRQSLDEAAGRLQWGMRPDADNDLTICGTEDDPRASHVAALREIDRLRGVQLALSKHHSDTYRIKNGMIHKYGLEKRKLECKVNLLERDLSALNTQIANLTNLPLTENKDAAVQTEFSTIQTDAVTQNDALALTDNIAQSGAPAQTEASVQTDQVLTYTVQEVQAYWDERVELEKANDLANGRVEILEKECNEKLAELDLVQQRYVNALDHIHRVHMPADALRDTVDSANQAYEKVMKAYQDPNMNMQLVTLLAEGGDLQESLESLQLSADIVVDGLKKTDDGMDFVEEARSIRQQLQARKEKFSTEGSGSTT
jgi:hypothetical protein